MCKTLEVGLILYFLLRGRRDYLTISSGTSTSEQFCGSAIPVPYFGDALNSTITFHSSSAISRTGFVGTVERKENYTDSE